MISCDKGVVKITGRTGEMMAEATVLIKAMYDEINKENGKKVADKFVDDITRRAKMSETEIKKDVASRMLDDIKVALKGRKRFEKGKKYIFDKDTYIHDMKSSDNFDDEDLEFASDYDGEEVKVVMSGLGFVGGSYPVHPDWCKEVGEPTFLTKFEDGKSYVFDIETYKKAESAEEVSKWPVECDGRLVSVASEDHGYIDLYGIKPEWCREVSSEYYNGKVAFAKDCLTIFEAGHIYEVFDGKVEFAYVDGEKGKYPEYTDGFKSFEELKKYFADACAVEVIEIKG